MSKKKNRDLWQQRVSSLTTRVKRGHQRNSANQTLFSYLVKEMRKEDGSDEIIGDLIEKITSMFEEIERALTHDDLRVRPAEKKEKVDEEGK